MKQETFCGQLAALTPDMPESFRLRVEAFLDEKVRQEAAGRAQVRHAGRRSFHFVEQAAST